MLWVWSLKDHAWLKPCDGSINAMKVFFTQIKDKCRILIFHYIRSQSHVYCPHCMSMPDNTTMILDLELKKTIAYVFNHHHHPPGTVSGSHKHNRTSKSAWANEKIVFCLHDCFLYISLLTCGTLELTEKYRYARLLLKCSNIKILHRTRRVACVTRNKPCCKLQIPSHVCEKIAALRSAQCLFSLRTFTLKGKS